MTDSQTQVKNMSNLSNRLLQEYVKEFNDGQPPNVSIVLLLLAV